MYVLRRFSCTVLLLILVVGLIACTASDQENQGSEVNKEVDESLNEVIVISGLESDELKITVAEIKGLPALERTVTGISSTGEVTENTVKGASLDDVLKKFGKS